ncbi:MAG TPA: alginate lyase family protein [Pyrinomonadaceae bacterium]|nr:alginate lyase family protein [Pyrinomonadaceae bacterium]
MSLAGKIKRALRAGVGPHTLLLEAGRRGRVALGRRRERALLTKATGDVGPARLTRDFAAMSASELLAHFRTRARPRFLPGFEDAAASAQAGLKLEIPGASDVIDRAALIVDAHRWPLLGHGAHDFGRAPDWLCDPVSGVRWPLDYHADMTLIRPGDRSDVRVVWELNRLAHLLTLGQAYAASRDARFASEFFRQLRLWRTHNPVGFGPNWACAMEIALRATNLLAAFRLFRDAPELDEGNLSTLLAMFDEHGAHIRRNLEFSHVATSNHYLSDVVGLLWLGVCLPELRDARAWREFGLRETLREMDKQVLGDGADCEASTGYHRLVTELLLYSFLLCRANGVEIEDRYWRRLRAMLEYMRAYVRPDGGAPLIGDTDSGQFLPLARRAADEHSYVLAVGAVAFKEPRFKPAGTMPAEVFWLLGEEGARDFSEPASDAPARRSRAFANAGTYILRANDLYMLFNASGAGLGGRGSHGHNDALGIEVSTGGASFIRDPGTYTYTADFGERHLFRSTAYHSTIEIDGAEQNTTDVSQPFVIGDEAHPRVLVWESDEARDLVVAEHKGYARLAAGPITHRRGVLFDKLKRFWLVTDTLAGAGEHVFRFVFHLAPGTGTRVRPDAGLEVCDRITAARLFIVPLDGQGAPSLEPRYSSRDYGAKEESTAACWTLRTKAPLRARWALVPVDTDEGEDERLELIETLKSGR